MLLLYFCCCFFLFIVTFLFKLDWFVLVQQPRKWLQLDFGGCEHSFHLVFELFIICYFFFLDFPSFHFISLVPIFYKISILAHFSEKTFFLPLIRQIDFFFLPCEFLFNENTNKSNCSQNWKCCLDFFFCIGFGTHI